VNSYELGDDENLLAEDSEELEKELRQIDDAI